MDTQKNLEWNLVKKDPVTWMVPEIDNVPKVEVGEVRL